MRDSQIRSFRPFRSSGVLTGRTETRPRGSICHQVQSSSMTRPPRLRSLSSAGLKISLRKKACWCACDLNRYGAEITFDFIDQVGEELGKQQVHVLRAGEHVADLLGDRTELAGVEHIDLDRAVGEARDRRGERIRTHARMACLRVDMAEPQRELLRGGTARQRDDHRRGDRRQFFRASS